MKKNYTFVLINLFLFVFFFVFSNYALAQSDTEEDDLTSIQPYIENSDAIGVRIIPNLGHYSIDHWYRNQGFSGSPQALVVDGYDAIRDGRTVYVGATNIKATDASPGNKSIYTNIYLISYNQNPSVKTVDILGQIVKNWKFNTDLKEKADPAPSCSISSVSCLKNADCASDQVCAPSSSGAANSCQLKKAPNCLLDSDCPKNFFCDSTKAKIIRDMKRINHLTEIGDALKKYKTNFGAYPQLSAGSYLSGRSISLWPSWSDTFLNELSISSKIVDPINRLGACPGFDSKTCWNPLDKKFFQSSDSMITLPANSYAYIYQIRDNTFGLCATFETSVAAADLNYKFVPGLSYGSNCIVDGLGNTPPRLINSQLTGEADKEFMGWVEFIDNENNPLTWGMSLLSSNWSSAWPGGLSLLNTNNPNQKKLYSKKAGSPGEYEIRLGVNDGHVSTLQEVMINIINTKPLIEAENITYDLNPAKPFKYNFYFSDDNLADYARAFSVIKKSGGTSSFNPLGPAATGFKVTTSPAGVNRYKVSYEYLIPKTYKFNKESEYNYTISVLDKYNDVSSKNIKINITNETPILNFNCPSEVRFNGSYSCRLGLKEQMSNNQSLNYSVNSRFNNLGINYLDSSGYVFLNANNINTMGGSATGTVSIQATNDYGASAVKSFALKLNTYCGDGTKQRPNSEGRGGIYNDGDEDCDGLDGVSLTVGGSSITAQYGCATYNSDTPYPITNNSYCVYKSPVAGGGYCGDLYCQMEKENYSNCPGDCLHLCKKNSNKCGDDGCGGNHGDCKIVGESCYSGNCCSSDGIISVFLFNDPVILGGEEGVPAIYFNEKKYKLKPTSIYSDGSYSVKVPVKEGKNVLAVEAQIENINNGINISLSHCSRELISPGNLANVKCVNKLDSTFKDSWFKIDYIDSWWPKPNINKGYANYLAVWANDYSSSNERLHEAYCRYSFNSNDVSISSCKPLVADKNCGSNGCGGYFRPNNCAASNSSNPSYVCNSYTNKCDCSSSVTCASKNAALGKNNGEQGSYCGFIADGCGGGENCQCINGLICNSNRCEICTPNCAGKNCGADDGCGNKCQTGICQSGVCDKGFCRTDYCNPECGEGYKCVNNKCEKEFCTPNCAGKNCGADDGCGNKCQTGICQSGVCDKGFCRTDYCNPECGEGYKCVNNKCEKEFCTPNCAGKNCGADDGCLGKCQTGRCEIGVCDRGFCLTDYCNPECGEGYECVNNECEKEICTPNCAGKNCGDDDDCLGKCQNQTCGTGNKCINGECKECVCGNTCGVKDNCGNDCTCELGWICMTNNKCLNPFDPGLDPPECNASCEQIACGMLNECGDVCINKGKCETGYYCINSQCEYIDPSGICSGQASYECSNYKNQSDCKTYGGSKCNWLMQSQPHQP